MKQIRVSVRSDDAVVRTGMETMLRQHPELLLLDRDDASAAAVLVLCVDVVDEESLAAMRRSMTDGPARTLLLVGAIREARLLDVIELGVATVVRRREIGPGDMLRLITAVESGAGELPPDLLGALLAQVGRARRAQSADGVPFFVPGLSDREVEVIRLVAEGLDTHEMAVKLNYSERTIKNVLHWLMTRQHLRNRAHAVAYAAQHGYL